MKEKEESSQGEKYLKKAKLKEALGNAAKQEALRKTGGGIMPAPVWANALQQEEYEAGIRKKEDVDPPWQPRLSVWPNTRKKSGFGLG